MAGRKPRIEVTERGSQTTLDVLLSDPKYKKRIQNPFGVRSEEIALKDPSRVARWSNGAIGADHVWKHKQMGWDQVRPDDVADLDQIGGYNVSPDGFIVRGARGEEVLMAQPRVVRDAVQAAKIEHNNRNMGNPNRMKQELVEAAGNSLGAEAADFLNSRIGPVGTITDSRERIERVDPD